MGQPRITYPGACVLQAVARGCRYGFDIMDFAGLPSGTVYPILRRYEKLGLLQSDWEQTDDAHAKGRPRRRNYELTEDGEAALKQAADRFALHQRIFAPEEAQG